MGRQPFNPFRPVLSKEDKLLIWRFRCKRLVQDLIKALGKQFGAEIWVDDLDPELLAEDGYQFRIRDAAGELLMHWESLHPETLDAMQERLDRFVVCMEQAASGSPVSDALPSALNRIVLPRHDEGVS